MEFHLRYFYLKWKTSEAPCRIKVVENPHLRGDTCQSLMRLACELFEVQDDDFLGILAYKRDSIRSGA